MNTTTKLLAAGDATNLIRVVQNHLAEEH